MGWFADLLLKKKRKYVPLQLNIEEFTSIEPMKETTDMTDESNNNNNNAVITSEVTLDQAVAKVQAEAKPVISIIEGYATWTDSTVSSLTESRNTLAERIARDQEELRQIDKVIEGMGLMKETIISEEPSFQTSETPTKSVRHRKPATVVNPT